MVEVLAD